jgi:uncharacterized protein (DUF1778 family)
MSRSVEQTADTKARVTLPKSFVDTRVVVEQVSDTEVRIRKVGTAAIDTPSEKSLRPLSDRDRDAFLALLDRPPKANAAFRRAVERHRRRR